MSRSQLLPGKTITPTFTILVIISPIKLLHMTTFLFCKKNKCDMGQIRDIMEKNVVTIEDDKTALDAANLISEKDVSFLVIMKNNIPVGVLSESDFVKRLAADDKKASEVIVSEIMSSNFRWVEPETEIEDAIQKMLNNNVRRLVILDNNKLAGVITQTDLTGFLRDKLLVDKTIKNIQKN